MNTHKIFKIISFALGIIGVIFFALVSVLDVGEGKNEGLVNAFIFVSYIAMLIGFLSVTYYVFKNLGSLSKESKKQLFKYVGVLLVVFVLSLLLANGDEVKLKDGGVISSTESRFIGAGLNLFYFLAIASVGSLLWASFYKSKK